MTATLTEPNIKVDLFYNRNIVTDIDILIKLKSIHCKEEEFIGRVREVFSKQNQAKLWFKWNYDYKINNPYYYFPEDSVLYQSNKYIDVPYNFSVTPITEPIRYYYRLNVVVSDGYVTVLESWQEDA